MNEISECMGSNNPERVASPVAAHSGAGEAVTGSPARLTTKEQWHVALGDKAYVCVPGVVKPINCGSAERAKLIAAAPELLAALREADDLIRDLIEPDSGLACDHGVGICACGPRAMVGRIRAALAKVAEVPT